MGHKPNVAVRAAEHTAEEVFCVCEPSDVQPASRRIRDRTIRRHRLFILNCGVEIVISSMKDCVILVFFLTQNNKKKIYV